MLCAGPSPRFRSRGPKTTRGATLFNTILDVCNNRKAKHEMGAQILNGETGPHRSSRLRRPWLCVSFHNAKFSSFIPCNIAFVCCFDSFLIVLDYEIIIVVSHDCFHQQIVQSPRFFLTLLHLQLKIFCLIHLLCFL